MEYTIRDAVLEDAEQIFQISNDPEVLAQSISRETILWEDHLNWFKSKLSDPDCSIVVACDSDLVLGQVKLSVGGQNIIGISMAKAARGKGIGAGFLKEASSLMLRKYPDMETITAQIKIANMASRKIFEKAGYVYCRNVEINNEIYQEYELRRQ